MTENRKTLMEVADESRPRPKRKRPHLSRDETLIRIGEINEQLAALKGECKFTREKIAPYLDYLHELQDEVRYLEGKKEFLEKTIAQVTKVTSIKKPKLDPKIIAMQKEIEAIKSELDGEQLEKFEEWQKGK